jgi:hypothetical protein
MYRSHSLKLSLPSKEIVRERGMSSVSEEGIVEKRVLNISTVVH